MRDFIYTIDAWLAKIFITLPNDLHALYIEYSHAYDSNMIEQVLFNSFAYSFFCPDFIDSSNRYISPGLGDFDWSSVQCYISNISEDIDWPSIVSKMLQSEKYVKYFESHPM